MKIHNILEDPGVESCFFRSGSFDTWPWLKLWLSVAKPSACTLRCKINNFQNGFIAGHCFFSNDAFALCDGPCVGTRWQNHACCQGVWKFKISRWAAGPAVDISQILFGQPLSFNFCAGSVSIWTVGDVRVGVVKFFKPSRTTPRSSSEKFEGSKSQWVVNPWTALRIGHKIIILRVGPKKMLSQIWVSRVNYSFSFRHILKPNWKSMAPARSIKNQMCPKDLGSRGRFFRNWRGGNFSGRTWDTRQQSEVLVRLLINLTFLNKLLRRCSFFQKWVWRRMFSPKPWAQDGKAVSWPWAKKT